MAENKPESEDPSIAASKAFDEAKNPEQRLAATTNLMGDSYLKDKGFGDVLVNGQVAAPETQPAALNTESNNSNQGILDKLSRILPFLKKKSVQTPPAQQAPQIPIAPPQARAA